MTKETDPQEMADFKQVLLSEVIQREALINLLVSKGILTRRELLDEVGKISAKLPKAET